MAYTFSQMQTEVKRRAVRDQGGTQFDNAIKNAINSSLVRISKEAPWKQLRRKSTFQTEGDFTTGTVTATNGSKTVTGASTTWVTSNIKIGRRMTISGSNKVFVITAVASNTSLTINLNYDGTTGASKTYTIYGTEEYTLPVQTGQVAMVWHEAYGYAYPLTYIPDKQFYDYSFSLNYSYIPTAYRLWGEDDVMQQPTSASVMRIASSASGDTSIALTVFGTVSSFPDFETITTNSADGTTAVSGAKSFSQVERIVKSASTTGRITVDSNSANVVVARLPVGNATNSIMYKKIQLYPLPDDIYEMNVQFYKDPWFLINDGDIHEFGDRFDEAIILLATAKLKAEQNQQESDRFIALYLDELKVLKKINSEQLDWWPTLKRPRDSRTNGDRLNRYVLYNQLGGSYGPSNYL